MALKSNFISWPNLSRHGMRMVVATLPSGDRRMVMIGGDKYPDELKSLGFDRKNGFWMRRDLNSSVSDFIRDVLVKFKQGYRQDVLRSEITHIMRPVAKPTEEELRTKIEFNKANPLGFNANGQEVFEGAEGRFIRSEGSAVLSEEKAPASQYLRAETDQDLDLCADGLIQGLLKGRVYRTEDITTFGKTIFGHEIDPGSDEYNRYHRAIGSALSRHMDANVTSPDIPAYSLAMRLHEGLPPVSGEFAERIVTLPMGVAAQLIVGADKAESLLVPDVGNGAFTSSANDSSILVGKGEGGWDRHDATLANLSYGELEEPIDFAGTKISRGDHVDLIRMLEHRSNTGKSVFFLKDIGKHGQVDDDTKKLLAWVSARFEIEGLAQMDSHLFGKGAGQAGRYMLVVGARGGKIFDADKSVTSIYDYDKLWEWSNSLIIGMERAAEEVMKLREENALQAPYMPFSQVTEPKAMIPRNLVGPVREALSRLEAEVGNIDAWVAGELAYEIEDLGTYFDSEQIDAVALSINAMKHGRGFIEADQTGLGKGRVLAAMVRWANINGLKTVFLTDKSKLFSDFFRDLRDIGSDDQIKHICLNAGVTIESNGVVLHKASKKETVAAMIDSGEVPDDVNLVLSTYSQYNRKDDGGITSGEKKARWLKSAIKGQMLILDESHLAAGTMSNTGVNVASAVAASESVMYSSATFAKDARNFAVYAKVFPPALRGLDVGAILSAGGDALKEVFSADLASEGVFIRREHDMSDLQIVTDIDTDHMERNEMLADKMANIMEALGVLSGEVEKFVNSKNRLLKAAKVNNIKSGSAKGKKRAGWQGVNFGAKLYNLQRQFMLVQTVEFAADKALQALSEGRKPVIGMENTMESMVKDALLRQDQLMSENDFDEEDPTAVNESDDEEAAEDNSEDMPSSDVFEDGRVLDGRISFREVIRKTMERICVVREMTETMTREEVIETEQVKKFKAAIELMIDAFPEVPVSPIDFLRAKIEEAGYTFGEYSSRSVGIVENEFGQQVVKRITENRNKNAILDGFNNGALDVLLLTTAGSTGISAHASKTFKDQRQREFIELQIANDVAIRMQFYGRTNRKGQVCAPIIRTLCLGIPSETRLLSMHNNKLRALSANTTSNQDSANMTDRIPDLLNKVGDQVARQYLLQDIDLAKRLAIDPGKLDDAYAKNVTSNTWYVDQLTGRLAMITTDEQRRVYEEISMLYEQRIMELDECGENPLRTKVLEWGAKRVSSEVITSGSNSGSVFDRDVTVTTVVYDEVINPISGDDIKTIIDKSLAKLKEDPRVGVITSSYQNFMTNMINVLKEKAISQLEKSLPSSFETVTEALNADGPNIVKSIRDRMEALEASLRQIRPGAVVTYSDLIGKHTGILTGVLLPRPGREHIPSEYHIRVHIPGGFPKEMNLHSFRLMDASAHFSDYNQREMLRKFDAIRPGRIRNTRYVLDGNLFMATQRALVEKMGTSIIYTDETGSRHRGILLPQLVSPELLTSSEKTTNNVPLPEPVAKKVMNDDRIVTASNNIYNYGTKQIEITKANGSIKLKLLSDSPTGLMLMNDNKFVEAIYDMDLNKKILTANVMPGKLNDVVDAIYDAGFNLFVNHTQAEVVREYYDVVRLNKPQL